MTKVSTRHEPTRFCPLFEKANQHGCALPRRPVSNGECFNLKKNKINHFWWNDQSKRAAGLMRLIFHTYVFLPVAPWLRCMQGCGWRIVQQAQNTQRVEDERLSRVYVDIPF